MIYDILLDLDNWEYRSFLNTQLNNLRKDAINRYLYLGFKYESSVLKEINSNLFMEVSITSLNIDGKTIFFHIIVDKTSIKNLSEDLFIFNNTKVNKDKLLEEIDLCILNNINYLNGLE